MNNCMAIFKIFVVIIINILYSYTFIIESEFQGGLKDSGFLENVKDILTVKDVMQV